MKLGSYLEKVKEERPLIHCITNYVTANDCANILLAIGASPVMADDIMEVEEITTMASGLNLNLGTLSTNRIPAMLKAGKVASGLGIPVILDPVGIGATSLRKNTFKQLIDEVYIHVLKGNLSEILTIASGSSCGRGVDSTDLAGNDFVEQIKIVKVLAEKLQTIVVATGPIDIISDGNQTYLVRNGHEMMGKVTGSGCMLSALMTAFLSQASEQGLKAAVASVVAMGVAGEHAYKELLKHDSGNAMYRHYMIDAVYNMTGELLEEMAKVERWKH